MKVSGATLLKDATRLGYPFVESIRSLLPLVDELVVNVAEGDAETWNAVAALGDPKLKPFRSRWDVSLRDGATLSVETNRALERCTGDWAVYLQADEVLHEDDLGGLDAALRRHLRGRTEGLVFDYLHFFRSYEVVADDWLAFYPRAVRAVRLGIGVRSAGDAAGFVRELGGRSRGLLKARAHARVFHYGWCGPVETRLPRANALTALYDPDRSVDAASLFPAELHSRRDLRVFGGAHPAVMRDRVATAARLPALPQGSPWPAALRAYARLLAAPLRFKDQARAFVPLVLTNALWGLRDLRARHARDPARDGGRDAARSPGPSAPR